MAAGLEPPKGMVIHGYLLMGEKKMSKSLGNVLDPFEAIERYGADALRFYCLREVSFGQDGSVSAAGFESRYETELANDFGNLASRTLAMIDRYRDGVVPEGETDPALASGADGLEGLGEAVRDLIDGAEPSQALEAIWVRVRRVNRYVEETRPWDLAKADGEAGAARRGALQPRRGAPRARSRAPSLHPRFNRKAPSRACGGGARTRGVRLTRWRDEGGADRAVIPEARERRAFPFGAG